ncbi:MAG TPA: F-box protein [Coxiellaceae bacterium]|nr:MAG: hypothetical protein A3E81_07560 [Gammaproteobacteria bacterium RIFCSPHIGHO2_12_FULL_36_30]HLB56554.1 F-box protein [Coxiellaceae bacterium]
MPNDLSLLSDDSFCHIILKYLDVSDLRNLRLVSKKYNRLFSNYFFGKSYSEIENYVTLLLIMKLKILRQPTADVQINVYRKRNGIPKLPRRIAKLFSQKISLSIPYQDFAQLANEENNKNLPASLENFEMILQASVVQAPREEYYGIFFLLARLICIATIYFPIAKLKLLCSEYFPPEGLGLNCSIVRIGEGKSLRYVTKCVDALACNNLNASHNLFFSKINATELCASAVCEGANAGNLFLSLVNTTEISALCSDMVGMAPILYGCVAFVLCIVGLSTAMKSINFLRSIFFGKNEPCYATRFFQEAAYNKKKIVFSSDAHQEEITVVSTDPAQRNDLMERLLQTSRINYGTT